jgi:hypothetical protein
MDVPGQGGLRASHPPGGQQFQQLLLGPHVLPGNQLQYQLLPVCFHRSFLPILALWKLCQSPKYSELRAKTVDGKAKNCGNTLCISRFFNAAGGGFGRKVGRRGDWYSRSDMKAGRKGLTSIHPSGL